MNYRLFGLFWVESWTFPMMAIFSKCLRYKSRLTLIMSYLPKFQNCIVFDDFENFLEIFQNSSEIIHSYSFDSRGLEGQRK